MENRNRLTRRKIRTKLLRKRTYRHYNEFYKDIAEEDNLWLFSTILVNMNLIKKKSPFKYTVIKELSPYIIEKVIRKISYRYEGKISNSYYNGRKCGDCYNVRHKGNLCKWCTDKRRIQAKQEKKFSDQEFLEFCWENNIPTDYKITKPHRVVKYSRGRY